MPEYESHDTETHIEEAGKDGLDDEMLPKKGEPVPQESANGNEPDTAGKHGPMAVETADVIGDKADEAEQKKR